MIQINLLPAELRVKEAKSAELSDLPIVPVGIGVMILLIVLHVVFLLGSVIVNASAVNLKKQWESYAPQKKELDTLNAHIIDIDSKFKTIEELTKTRVLWAEILSGLSDSTLDNVWYNGLSYEEKSDGAYLYLDGYAAGPSEEATASVGRLINALKEDKKIAKYITNVELQSIQESSYEKREIMHFKLKCIFIWHKEAAVVKKAKGAK